LQPSSRANRCTAGFSLIEVLVALAVIATALSPIAALIATAARANRSMEAHLQTLAIARSRVANVMNSDRTLTAAGNGAISGHLWQSQQANFSVRATDERVVTPWVPQTVTVSVESPTGVSLQITTVRLAYRRP
jgi:general secretion pathway protein I